MPTVCNWEGIMNPWDQVKQCLSTKLRPQAFQNWISPTSFVGLSGETLLVGVPNEATKQWLEQEYTEAIHDSIRELVLPCASINFVVGSRDDHDDTTDSEAFGGEGFGKKSGTAYVGTGVESLFAGPRTQLDERFSFENFVVGSCNQFAHAAAVAVSRNLSSSYNPLFVYGGTGVGKTHLMHAIGLTLLEKSAGTRVVYTSSERFMNAMVACLKTDKMSLFHRHFRSADVLLVDDVHILAGKERTQEEFFYTFNELYEHQKQIVITSDSPPKSTPGLVERLRSRFEWGLMVDMQPPDLETKMAILDKKAEEKGIRLPQDVQIFIATKAKSNVRELEGALIKLMAYSNVTGSAITLPMAQQVLKQFVHVPDKRVSMDSVVRAVGEKYALTPQQLKAKTNAHAVAFPRQVAMYLIKEMTSASLSEIGRAFGGKHHTTVLHSIQKIERQRQSDTNLNAMIHSIIDSFQ